MLPLRTAVATVAHYEAEADRLDVSIASGRSPLLNDLALKRIAGDLPLLLATLNANKNSKTYKPTHASVLSLASRVDELLFANSRLVVLPPPAEPVPTQLPAPEAVPQRDNYASLRKRLLADGASSSLDDAPADKINEYHETFQQDLMGDLSELASALKESASSLSSKIVDDSKLVATTGENLMKSLTLMQTVGSNLNGYLSAKSGGKITVFFLIKTMAFIFALAFCTIVIIKILPRM